MFDIVSTREPLGSTIEGEARAFGFKGTVKFSEPTEAWDRVLSTSLVGDAARARDLLGWKPEKVTGMLDEIDICVSAWKAHKSG